MSTKSLWGDLTDIEIVRTPKEVLNEQANALTEATKGVLVGSVTVREVPPKFIYDLDVSVPALNNYTYTILTITHEITLYPVRVTVAVTTRARFETCENEEEFVHFLENLLSSKDVRFILSRLLSQASK